MERMPRRARARRRNFQRHRIALSSARAKLTSGFLAYPTFPTHTVPAGSDFFEANYQSFGEIDIEPDDPGVLINSVRRAVLSRYASPGRLYTLYTGANGSTPNCALFSMTIATSSPVMHCAEEANP